MQEAGIVDDDNMVRYERERWTWPITPCEKTPTELYLESVAEQYQLHESLDIMTAAVRQISDTLRMISAAINDAIKEIPREYLEKTYQIERIKNNALLGNANKRRLIRMINRAYRERGSDRCS